MEGVCSVLAEFQADTYSCLQALGINFATLTPEMLLHVARVLQSGDQLVVEPMAEHSAGEVSFGGAVAEEEGGKWAHILRFTTVCRHIYPSWLRRKFATAKWPTQSRFSTMLGSLVG